MIRKFNRIEPEYRNLLQNVIEFIVGEYILYLVVMRAYDPVEDEFNYRRSFWVSTITLFSIIISMTVLTAATLVIIRLL